MKKNIKNCFSLATGMVGIIMSSVISGNATALEAQPQIIANITENSLIQERNSIHLARQVYRGKASWYGGKFHGRRTANGEIYNSNALTAAHKTLPFNTRVRVTNLANGRSVVVRINDRGPFIKGRIIDVSAGAARKLNMIDSGIANVKLEILGR